METESIAAPIIGATQINGSMLPPKTVVLTYDDGPDEHTLELARYLADSGVKVTFFLNGRRFCQTFDAAGNCMTPQEVRRCDDGMSQAAVMSPKFYPEALIDQVLALGHRVANHTQDHCHLRMQTTPADLVWELSATQEIIDRHICDDLFMFRAPYGEWDAAAAQRLAGVAALAKLVGPINWDVDGGDWACWMTGVTPAACAQMYLDLLNARPNKNGIFLMHDRPEFNVGYDGPLAMAKILVPMLKAAGYAFATMTDVLKVTPTRIDNCPKLPAVDASADSVAGQEAGAGDGGAGRTDAGNADSLVDTAGAGGAGGSDGGTGAGAGQGGNAGNTGIGGSVPPAATGGGSSGGCHVSGEGSTGSAADLLLALLAAVVANGGARTRQPARRSKVGRAGR